MAPRRKPGDPIIGPDGLASWPAIGCQLNKTIRVREALVDTSPCVWVIIEEPPSFTNPGGYELAAWMPLGHVAGFAAQLRSRSMGFASGTDSLLPVPCEHGQTLAVACKGDQVTVTIDGPTGRGGVILTGDGLDVLVERLGWLNVHHYHLSQP